MEEPKLFFDVRPTNRNLEQMCKKGCILLEFHEVQGWHYNSGEAKVETFGWHPVGFMPWDCADKFFDIVEEFGKKRTNFPYFNIEEVRDFYKCFCEGYRYCYQLLT